VSQHTFCNLPPAIVHSRVSTARRRTAKVAGIDIDPTFARYFECRFALLFTYFHGRVVDHEGICSGEGCFARFQEVGGQPPFQSSCSTRVSSHQWPSIQVFIVRRKSLQKSASSQEKPNPTHKPSRSTRNPPVRFDV
jgi:hypothetical protein